MVETVSLEEVLRDGNRYRVVDIEWEKRRDGVVITLYNNLFHRKWEGEQLAVLNAVSENTHFVPGKVRYFGFSSEEVTNIQTSTLQLLLHDRLINWIQKGSSEFHK